MIKSVVASLLSVIFSVHALADAPVGEKANYQLDRRRSRTTPSITGGHAVAEVMAFFPDSANGPEYEVRLDYTITAIGVGTEEGVEIIDVPEEFFTPAFMVKLRAKGELHYPDFKIRHLGYEDARTMQGRFYPNCDKIRIFDINTESATALVQTMKALALQATGVKIEKLDITSWMAPGVPVINAAKLDISGVVEPKIYLKAGLDYVAPSAP